MNFFTRHKKIILSLMIFVMVFGALVVPTTASVAHAADSVGEGILERTIYPFIGNFAYFTLVGASVFLRVTASLLNTAIVQTLHISDLVKSAGAIESTWLIIRNFSNIFFIFMLLYAGIVMILDTKGPKFGELVKSIVIAGLLINFSLFFTKLAIDTSNVVALSFYKAIDAASPSQTATPENSTWGGQLKNTFTQGDVGLANAFMQGLKIQTIYSNSARLITPVNGMIFGVTRNLVIATAGGAIVMIIAGISFLVAAVMFLARIAILLLLMAFSPIFFIGMILPEVQPYAKKWLDELVAQCMFAPLYLMFMYVVLRIVLDPAFGAFLGVTSTSNFAEEISKGGSAGLLVQYAIIIILINYGLVASKQYAGSAAQLGDKVHKWANKATSTYGYGMLARQTYGRYAEKLDDKIANSKFAGKSALNNQLVTGLRSITTGAVAGSKFGGDKSFLDDKKDKKEAERRVAGIDRVNTQREAIRGIANSGAHSISAVNDFRATVGKMTTKELEKIKIDDLAKPDIAATLSSKQVEGLLKSDELSPTDVERFKEARTKGLETKLSNKNQLATVKMSDFDAIMKEDFDGSQKSRIKSAREQGYLEIVSDPLGAQNLLENILKSKAQDIAKLPENILKKPEVSVLLDAASLKEMIKEVGAADRTAIRANIDAHLAVAGSTITHQFQTAYDYLNGPAGAIF